MSQRGRHPGSADPIKLVGASLFDYVVAIGIFALACIACWAMDFSDDGAWLPPLYAGSAGGALYLWWRTKWPDDAARYLSFGGIGLLSCAAFHALAYVDYLNAGERFSEWPFPVADPIGAVFKGEVMTFVGTIAAIATWQKLGGLSGSAQALFEPTPRSSSRFFVLAYVVSVAASVASIVAEETVRGLGHLIPILVALGAASVLVLPSVWARSPVQRLLLSGLLSVPFLLASLGTGMKSQILIAALPVALNAWTYFRSTAIRLLLVVVTFTVIAIVTSYVGYFREQVWYQKREATASQVLDEFADDAERDPVGTLTNGLESFVARSNMTFARAWGVTLADEQQREPELVLAPLLYLFVPRVFWPEKPANEQGQDYTVLVFGVDTSSTAVGLFTGFYLAAGWLCVVVGTLLVGATTAVGQVASRRLGGEVLESTYVIVLMPSLMTFSDSWPVAVIAEPLFAFVYLYLIYLPLRLISPEPTAITTK